MKSAIQQLRELKRRHEVGIESNQQDIKHCKKCQELDKAKKSDTCDFHLIIHQIEVGRVGVLNKAITILEKARDELEKNKLRDACLLFKDGESAINDFVYWYDILKVIGKKEG